MAESKCVLALMAHPDDAEFACAGTLARLHREHGWRVAIATMTPGDCGSATLGPDAISRLRVEEARAAAAILDADYHCAGLRDLFITYDRDALNRATEIVRRAAPDVVITHGPQDYMVDHEMTSRLVRTACFGGPIPNFYTDAASPAQPTGAVPYLYYADAVEGHDLFGQAIEPSTVVDITGVMAVKERMLCCHATQRDWLKAHHGMDEYVESMKQLSARRGELIGTNYAEAFVQHHGHAYPRSDLLAETLGARSFDD